jgi:hypothetical protein
MVAPPPAARLVQRVAAKTETQEGLEDQSDRADQHPDRAPLPRAGSSPDYGSLNGLPATALMTAAGPLATKLEAMTRQIGASENAQNATIRSVSQVALAMTAGYVMWSLRGVSLVASLLTSLPLWRSLDPLPILEGHADREKAKAAVKRRKKSGRGTGAADPDGPREDDDRLKSMMS